MGDIRDILEYLRPDSSAKDRDSMVESYHSWLTQRERDKLDRLTKEHTAIITHGKI